MIYKESLLNEFKRDKRPKHGCLTFQESIYAKLTESINSSIKKRAAKDAELMQNYLSWIENVKLDKPKTFRIVRYDRLKLPKES